MSAPVYNKGFDVLRGAVTLLVVFHHTAITYGGSGGWFYREVPQSGQ
jgi:peptidoglycan/LPS O-acetylase OafA/YrhL